MSDASKDAPRATDATQLPTPSGDAPAATAEAEVAAQREELLEAMGQQPIKREGELGDPAEGGGGGGGGGAPAGEPGETFVGGGTAANLASAMFGANSLVARRQALLAGDKSALRGVGGGDGGVDKEHKFWDTQPVKKLSDVVEEHGPIDEEKKPADVQQEPYNLPKGFEWSTMNVKDPKQLREIYKLLTKNYVEDDDAMFRFDYSEKFLLWALAPPGYFADWHVGVRQSSNGRLRGFISGIPAVVQVHDNNMPMSEINFLCVHQGLRDKRLAPVLIKEVTRRVNLRDQWQAVYTAGIVLPKPVSRCHYWHRSINAGKLIDIGFSRLGPRMTKKRLQKLLSLPNKPKTPGFRKMVEKDVPQVHKLLMEYLTKFKLYIRFTPEEVSHWLVPKEGVVDCYVVENSSGEITDFCSYYHLPSSILKVPKYKTLNAVYSYYNVANTVTPKELMTDCLVMARDNDSDVFNCLDLMDNAEFLKDLKFGIGDGKLQYYLYNWQCPEMPSKDVGIVLL